MGTWGLIYHHEIWASPECLSAASSTYCNNHGTATNIIFDASLNLTPSTIMSQNMQSVAPTLLHVQRAPYIHMTTAIVSTTIGASGSFSTNLCTVTTYSFATGVCPISTNGVDDSVPKAWFTGAVVMSLEGLLVELLDDWPGQNEQNVGDLPYGRH